MVLILIHLFNEIFIIAYDINELVVSNEEINKRIQNGIEQNRKGNFTVRTTNGEFVADENERTDFRGLYGEYEVTVGGKTYTVNFDENGKEEIL